MTTALDCSRELIYAAGACREAHVMSKPLREIFVSHGVLFREVRARLSSMSAWIECYYGPQPLLTLGSSTIYSYCGV